MKLTFSEFKKWHEWAERIDEDVTLWLVEPRQVYLGFVDIVDANKKHIEENEGGIFVLFVAQCYGSQAIIAIRRHLKVSNESISLMRLLEQIRDCASQFTYAFYLEQFPIDPKYVRWQVPTFRQFSEDGKTVAPALVQKDIDELKDLGATIEVLADRKLAHLDKRGFDGSVTFGELHQCIDAFNRVVCKYLKLIRGGGPATLEPSIILDWKKIFRVPFDIRRTTSE
ncbi:MAG: hypothetical protein L0215_18435 [Gemmataceae bacterium]|nr:hypothetical protein [Gemmataceae bacterium]